MCFRKEYFNKTYVALFIFICIALVFCAPLLKNIVNWGVEDWDEYFFRNALARTTILRYQQFPLWNPYTCGGNVFLAHPASGFLSPFFIFILLFGEVVGLKITVVVYLIIGMFGMFLLARYLGLEFPSSYLAAFIYMLNAIYPMHVTAGLVGEFTMAFMPLIFLFYLKGFQNKKYLLLSALFIFLMLAGGSLRAVIIFSLFLFVYSLFKAGQERGPQPVENLFVVFIFAFFLSAIKTIPMLEFLKSHAYIKENLEIMRITELPTLLFRKVSTYDPEGGIFSRLAYDWYHCGSYIGTLSFFLFIVAAILYFRTNWPLVFTGIIFLFLAAGKILPTDKNNFIYSLPVLSSILSSLYSRPRFILGLIFTISIMAGMGLSRLENFFPNNFFSKVSAIIIVIFILFDLVNTNGPLLKEAFTLPPQEGERSPFFHQGLSSLDYLKEDSDVYQRFLSNRGTINAQEIDNVYISTKNVLAFSSPDYKGEAYLWKGSGMAKIKYFSPNKVIVEVTASGEDTFILNQNFYKGWKVKKGKIINNACNFEGLIAAPVSPGKLDLEFFYLPDSFILGVILSFLTALLGIFLIMAKPKKELIKK
jgi:hypothetical protein